MPRSVIFADSLDLHLKLSLGIKLTAAVRTITTKSAHFGPWFSLEVVPLLAIDRNVLGVARELASIVHMHPDRQIARHCAAIIREGYEEYQNERLIVCVSLIERGHAGADGHLPSVVRAFGLDTEIKRLQWLEK